MRAPIWCAALLALVWGRATGAAGIDLTMTALSGAPASAGVGKSFTVSNTVKTTGAVTRSFTVGIYLSADATITTADTLVGSRAVASLGANASSTASTSVTVPVSLAPGSYYLGAIADSGGVVAETNEANNTVTAGARLTVVGADLTMTALSGAPATVAAGGSFTVTSTVAAAPSGGNAGPFSLGFYLSTDAVITTADILVGSRAVSSLAAGAASTATTTVTVPLAASPRAYYFGAVADMSGAVTESSETNNALQRGQVTVTGADLAITAVSGAPAKIGVGDSFTAADTVASAAGGATVGPFSVGFYLSTDPAITSADISIGARQVPGLAPGQSSSGTTTITIPGSVAPGTYTFGAFADPAGAIPEVNRANNASASGQVVIGPYSCQHPSTPLDDGNPCTVDSCDPSVGVVHAPATAGTTCSPASACMGAGTCDGAGRCQPGPAKAAGVACRAINDGLGCADSCDGSGSCVTGRLATRGSACPFPTACAGICDGVSRKCQPVE